MVTRERIPPVGLSPPYASPCPNLESATLKAGPYPLDELRALQGIVLSPATGKRSYALADSDFSGLNQPFLVLAPNSTR